MRKSWPRWHGVVMILAGLVASPTVVSGAAAAPADPVPRPLAAAMAQLTAAPAPASSVTSWYVDVESGTVVVEALPHARSTAARFIQASGADPELVRIQAVTSRPRLTYDVRGGDATYPGSSTCSVGFSVSPHGFVTAGHCGGVGTSTRGYNLAYQGVFQRSSFPSRDAAYVAVTSNWLPRPWVNDYQGGNIVVLGAEQAPPGTSVCWSGAGSGYRCGGQITHLNVTVNYPPGPVHGLTRATGCIEPGDSGGAVLAGQQAQGVISSGSGQCGSGGYFYFQPLPPVLSMWGLTLQTGVPVRSGRV